MRKLLIILGVPIDDMTFSEALERIDEFIQVGRQTGKVHQIATVNADFAVKALEDPELRLILRESDMATADGMPLVWGARLLGIPVQERVTGADLVPALAKLAADKGYSIYFFGAADGIAQQAADILTERHPNLKVAGVASPPYGSILDMDRTYIDDIKAAKPDILLVALGNPKQEKWISLYGKEVGAPVNIGIGGTFDFIAGATKRAPEWMQSTGLEWIYRLAQEPRRLWKRYVNDLTGFSTFFFKQWWHLRQTDTGAQSLILPEADLVIYEETAIIKLSGRLDRQNYSQIVRHGENALRNAKHIEFHMGETIFLDSSAIGSLVLIAKEARDLGGDAILRDVPDNIVQTLALLQLNQFFVMYDKDGNLIETDSQPIELEEDWKLYEMPARIGAANSKEIVESCGQLLHDDAKIVLDFGQTRLLETAGVATLAEINKMAKSQNSEVKLANCSDDVMRVLKMVKFDQMFDIVSDLSTSKA